MKKHLYLCLFWVSLAIYLSCNPKITLQDMNKDHIVNEEHNTLDERVKTKFLDLIKSVYESFLKDIDRKEFRIEWLNIPSTNRIKGDYLDKIKKGFIHAINDFMIYKGAKLGTRLIYCGDLNINEEEMKEKQKRKSKGFVRVPIRVENPLDAQISCTAYPLSLRKDCEEIILRCWIPLENKGYEDVLEVGENIYNTPGTSNESGKKEEIKISFLYKCPNCKKKYYWIGSGSIVHTGGLYWFDIKLPQMHGYLIVYQVDSKGKVFNLFPGTKGALLNGHYKVPYHLFYDCSTNILEVAAKSSKDLLEQNKIRIGSYKFDETIGEEQFFFYYSNERSTELERYLGNKISVGKDYKGTVPGEEPKSPKLGKLKLEKSKINKPLKIDKIVTCRLVHKNN